MLCVYIYIGLILNHGSAFMQVVRNKKNSTDHLKLLDLIFYWLDMISLKLIIQMVSKKVDEGYIFQCKCFKFQTVVQFCASIKYISSL